MFYNTNINNNTKKSTHFFIAFTKCGLGFNELAVSHDSRMVE